VTNYSYDAVSRPTQIVHDLAGTSNDLTLDFGHNPAGQIASTTRSNPGSGPGQADAYAWTDHYAVARTYAADGLNRYSAVGAIEPTYDPRGNMTSAGTTTYSYTADNRIATAGGSTMVHNATGEMVLPPSIAVRFLVRHPAFPD